MEIKHLRFTPKSIIEMYCDHDDIFNALIEAKALVEKFHIEIDLVVTGFTMNIDAESDIAQSMVEYIDWMCDKQKTA